LLRYPGELIRARQLGGEVSIRINNLLLSGRELAWLTASGERPRRRDEAPSLTQQSVLKGDFIVMLHDQLSLRHTATYRRWSFPGVDLSYSRLSDVAAGLRDLGYQIDSLDDGRAKEDQEQQPGPQHQTGFIRAHRSGTLPNGNPVDLELEICMRTEKPAETRRERQIPEGMLVSTEQSTNDLIIEAYSRMEGPGNLLDMDLEQMMLILQKRLATVAELR
jgi:hypothetical protein